MKRIFISALALLGMGTMANAQFYVVGQDGTVLYKMDEGTPAYVTFENPNSYNGTVGTPVDLGLTSGTLWADHNIGATNASDAGDYYQWGEVTTHYSAGGNTDSPTWKEGYSAGYNWSTYKWCKGSYDTQTKYVPQSKASDYGYEGFYDDKVTLEKADDVASQTWGGSWVVPTHAQQEELYNECYWVWTNGYNGTGVHGYIVYKAKEAGDKGTIVYDGNTPSSSYSLSDVHIFLPAAGDRWGTDLLYVGNYGYYWSSSLSEYFPFYAWSLDFYSDGVDPWGDYGRSYGFSVRPVCPGVNSGSGQQQKPDDGIEGKVISERDYTALSDGSEIFWMYDYAKEVVTIDEKGFTMVNTAELENPWDNQYLILAHFFGCVSGADYHIYVTMVSDGAGTMDVRAGSWSNEDVLSFDFEAGEKTYDVAFSGIQIDEDADHIRFWSGKFVGTYTIKKVVFTMVKQ